MASYRETPFLSGEYFHVYNRGSSKQEIFFDDKDRDRFIKLLYLCNSKKKINFRDDIVEQNIDAFDFERGETLVSISAWVLMPNHFHIYIVSPTRGVGEEVEDEKDDANITLFMHKLCTSYAKYFNIRHNRTGTLFEGPFKATHIENNNQAKYLFSYIHLNPIKLIDSKWKEDGISDINTALKYLNDYKWSSFHDHHGILRKENKILELKNFPEYFSNIKDFDSEIFSWLQCKESPLPLG